MSISHIFADSNFSGGVLPQTLDPATLDSACSAWKGIYCGAEESVEVITLEQALNGEGPRTVQYQSTIPAALGLFPNLSYLNLRRGGWIGRVPPEIFTPVMERLELAGNNLTGLVCCAFIVVPFSHVLTANFKVAKGNCECSAVSVAVRTNVHVCARDCRLHYMVDAEV
jgi:hypothetical protein